MKKDAPKKQKKSLPKRVPRFHRGISAAPGICIGNVYVLEKMNINFPRYWVSNKETSNEISRFEQALSKTRQELDLIKEKLCKFKGEDQFHLLDAYSLILQDEMLSKNTQKTIENEHINAEWALYKNLTKIKEVFETVDTTFLRERFNDFHYMGERILNHLAGESEELFLHVPSESIIVTHELSPAEATQLIKLKIRALVTEIGGPTSHTAIISRALEIPAVVGATGITKKVHTGDRIIVDGALGNIIVRPNAKEEKEYERVRQHQNALKKTLLKDIHLPAETKDGYRIRLVANMELTEEINSIKENGAEGVGLFRTEFLFLNRKSRPTEEEHFNDYKKVLSAIYPNYTTIRTLDVGGDKIPTSHPYETETNPALGLRAVRFCLREKQIFKDQLRAMLRASIFGKLKILVPMVSCVDEVKQFKSLLEEVKQDFDKEQIEYDPHLKVGIMIEVPSSVMIADELAKEVDFFSIGTNDLIQYTMAVDRSNEHVSYLYQPLHPAVLRMIKHTIDAANRQKIEVSVCGEMAGDPRYILILLGMGLHELSMNALSIPTAKRMIRSINFHQARALFNKTLSLKSSNEMERALQKELQNLFGDKLPHYLRHSS